MRTQESLAVALSSTISLVALVIAVALGLFGAACGGCEVRHLSEKHACRSGSVEKCLEVGRIYAAQSGDLLCEVLHYDDTERTYFGRACELGSPEGCYQHAALTFVGDDPAAWAATEVRELTVGCAGKIPEACSSLADIYAGGVGIPRDDARALALYVPACESHVAEACRMVDLMHSQGRGAPLPTTPQPER